MVLLGRLRRLVLAALTRANLFLQGTVKTTCLLVFRKKQVPLRRNSWCAMTRSLCISCMVRVALRRVMLRTIRFI